jgi:hypothetical protein
MKNTKSILLVALITATLVLGTSVTPMQSYADRDNNDNHKKDKDFKSAIIAGSESDKKSASQHQDQDNFCYRSDGCEQANQGQQIVGEDNDAKGFNDQSNNIPLLTPGTGAGAGAGAGAGNGNGNGNGGGTNTNPVTNNFITNNNVTVNVDNSICDQVSTSTATLTNNQSISQENTQSQSSNIFNITGSVTGVGNNAAVATNTNNGGNAAADTATSGAASNSCTVTLTNSSNTDTIVSTNPTILPNPTGAPCTTPLVNAVLTIANPPRTLDLCVNL